MTSSIYFPNQKIKNRRCGDSTDLHTHNTHVYFNHAIWGHRECTSARHNTNQNGKKRTKKKRKKKKTIVRTNVDSVQANDYDMFGMRYRERKKFQQFTLLSLNNVLRICSFGRKTETESKKRRKREKRTIFFRGIGFSIYIYKFCISNRLCCVCPVRLIHSDMWITGWWGFSIHSSSVDDQITHINRMAVFASLQILSEAILLDLPSSTLISVSVLCDFTGPKLKVGIKTLWQILELEH